MVQEYKVKVYEDMTKWFNMEDQIHRLDGPAVEWSNGTKEWYVNGQIHRLDGPAVEWSDGHKEWFVNGQELTEKEFNRKVNPVKELTVNEISKLLGYEVKIVKS